MKTYPSRQEEGENRIPLALKWSNTHKPTALVSMFRKVETHVQKGTRSRMKILGGREGEKNFYYKCGIHENHGTQKEAG